MSMRHAALCALFTALCACDPDGRTQAVPLRQNASDADVGGISHTQAADPASTFEPLSPAAQASKIKTLMTSQAPTDAEVAALTAKPDSMGDLVSTWMAAPEYQPKMLQFLGNAFQQSQVAASDFMDQGLQIDYGTLTQTESDMLVQNLRESFPRSVLQNDADGMPFTSVTSTQRFMLTPPLAAYYIYLDGITFTDSGQFTDSYGAMANDPNTGVPSFRAVMDGFSMADYSAWKPYTIRQPKNGERTTAWYNRGAVASASELVLNTPRRGFYTTPAFFAGWRTNTGNVARVTINQAFIVGLGEAFDGIVPVQPLSLAAVDVEHAKPGTPCYGCHVAMDPMKQFLRQAYSLHFSRQTDPKQIALPGQFAFGSVAVANTAGLDTMAQTMGTHPQFAPTWVRRLCAFANDGPCQADDPEVQRLTKNFAAGGYSFAGLVKDMMSSPLTTYSSYTATGGQLALALPVTKRDHLCPLLSTRLGIDDVCALQPGTAAQGGMATVKTIASVLPANGYSRGALEPTFANDPTLFFRSSLENICGVLSARVVDGDKTKFSSKDVPTALTSMAQDFMAVPAAQVGDAVAILQDDYNKSVATGASPTDALRSTFVASCTSPAIAGMAQ